MSAMNDREEQQPVDQVHDLVDLLLPGLPCTRALSCSSAVGYGSTSGSIAARPSSARHARLQLREDEEVELLRQEVLLERVERDHEVADADLRALVDRLHGQRHVAGLGERHRDRVADASSRCSSALLLGDRDAVVAERRRTIAGDARRGRTSSVGGLRVERGRRTSRSPSISTPAEAHAASRLRPRAAAAISSPSAGLRPAPPKPPPDP